MERGSSSSTKEIPTTAAVVILLLAGIALSSIALILRGSEVWFAIMLAVGSSLIATAAVVTVERLVPPVRQRNKILRSHWEIYGEFGRLLGSLDVTEPHVIRTINSFVPEKQTEEEWDSHMASFLTNSRQSQFIRVIFDLDTPEWKARLETISRRCAGLPNYHQHRMNTPSPPAIEMFLVDKMVVILSFATPEQAKPPITYGIELRDPELCEQLEAYHRIQLEGRIPRETLVAPKT